MIRAFDFRRLSAVRTTRKQLVVPIFSQASIWAGVSQMLTRFTISVANAWSFELPIIPPNSSFVAAVSWTDGSGYVYRYKLWDDGVLYFPVYAGERIGTSNVNLEIWSVENEALAYLDEEWILRTSKLILPEICTTCVEGSESVGITENPFTSVPPYQYCNPFCSPLCS